MSNLQKIDELENTQLLSGMGLDFSIFKLKQTWNSPSYIWQRWIRSN